jgi:hypothetical protein
LRRDRAAALASILSANDFVEARGKCRGGRRSDLCLCEAGGDRQPEARADHRACEIKTDTMTSRLLNYAASWRGYALICSHRSIDKAHRVLRVPPYGTRTSPPCGETSRLRASPWKLGRVAAPRQARKKMAPLCRQALSWTIPAAGNRFCGLFLGVRRGIRYPAIDRGLAPTAAMLANPNLLRKRAAAHLAVKRGPAKAGSLEDGPHP